MCEFMNKVKINLLEQIQKQMPTTLIKDLQDDERICPHCNGLGMVIVNNIYGIKNDNSEEAKNSRFPYKHQALSFCPDCYNGIQKLCPYCGNPYPTRGYYRCNCYGFKKHEAEVADKKYQEKILNATEVLEESVTTMLYCKENDEYYETVDDFLDAYDAEYFEDLKPSVLWVCLKESISLCAGDIVEVACEDLHEDAAENCDIDELQELLNVWCGKQTGTTTYYPSCKEYVRIDWSKK